MYLGRKHLALIFLFIFLLAMFGMENISGSGFKSEPVIEPFYRGNEDEKVIALTFNVDWGEDVLPSILETLSKNGSPATFFITGRFAANFPELVKEIYEQGHEIGNHGYSHNHPNSANRRENQEEILKTEEVIKKLIGEPEKLFAPPYGECSPAVVEAAHDIGYKTIMWTIDTIDWKPGRTPESIAQKVHSRAQNGAIVLMHPRQVTVEALPKIIGDLEQEGYTFKTVSQIITPSSSQNN